MLFKKLHLDYFGRFRDYTIDMHPGINLIYGDNEAGKSTIHTFIKGMLFGIERARGRASASKEDIYARYLPWDYPGAYRGSMDIEIDDKRYRIHRSFHANDKYFTVTDLETGRNVHLKNDHISDIIPGLNESTYRNTISIEQLKVSTDARLALALGNYMANLSISKSNEVNVSKALNSLTARKKALENAIDSTEYMELKDAIQDREKKEQQLDSLTMQLKKLFAEHDEIVDEKQRLMEHYNEEEINRMDYLPAILEKYRNFKAFTRQSLQIKEKRMEIQQQKALIEKKLNGSNLQEDMKLCQEMNAKLQEQNLKRQELQQSINSLVGNRNKRLRLILLVSSILAIAAFAIINSKLLGILIGAMAILAGLFCYAFISRNIRKHVVRLRSQEAEVIKKQSAWQEKLSVIYARYQVATFQELLQKQEEYLQLSYAMQTANRQLEELLSQESATENQRDYVYEEIMKYMQNFLSEDELSDEAIKRLEEEISRRRQKQQQLQRTIDEKLHTNKMAIEKYKWMISELEKNEEELLKLKARLSELEQMQKNNACELEAVKLALRTIQDLSASIHDSFGNQLNTAISDIIKKVTNDKYTDVKVDEKLNIKVELNGNYIPFDKLSTGTIDQIYLSLRIAVADLLLGKNTMPLILDDSFAYYDDERVRTSLQQLSTRQQVILFTCHKREQQLLEELKLPYHYVELQ